MEFKVLYYASYQAQETAAGYLKDLDIECFISSSKATIIIDADDYDDLLNMVDSNINLDDLDNKDELDYKDNEKAYLVLELANN